MEVPASAAPGVSTSTRNRIKIRKKSQLQRSTPDESEDYSAEKRELLNKQRRNLILEIKRFIREATADDQKAELNLRLGALYMEDYHFNLAKAQVAFERETASYEKNKKSRKRAPKLDNSEAVASLNKARAIYKDLLKRYPSHGRRDEMFYFLAISSLDKGSIDEGMAYFKQLSEQVPNSRYVNDALVQLGDYYFDANKFPEAETYYNKIISRKYQPLIPYVTYKKAWCAYNLGKQPEALKLFKWVILREEAASEDGSSPVRIRNEALKDITLPFTDLKLVEESIAFFQNAGDPHFRSGLETMASLYYEAGEYNNSIVLWERLLQTDANHVKNPSYEINIVEALKLKHDEDGAINRLFSRLPNYMSNSNWYEINAANPTAIKEATTAFEETAWKYGVQYHAEAQRTKNAELYNYAKKLYVKYLEYFPRHARSPKVRFQLAEILYKNGRYVEAADHYYIVYKEPTAGDLKLDAIRAALMSLDRQLNLDRKKAGLAEINSKMTSKLKEKEDTSLELTPYSPVESKFVSISEEYLAKYPTAKDAADVLYEGAYLQYSHHDFNKAYKSFWVMIQKYPTHESAQSSAHLILDILNRKKDYPKLVAACKRFLQVSELSKGNFKTDVADILRHGELKRIQSLEEKEQYKAAADEYVEYTKAYGIQDENLFEKALFNASVNYTKAGMYINAVETQEKFLRRFQKSALRENMLLQVAKTYEILANFEKSAQYYELFTQSYPNNPQTKNAMRLSGLYFWGAGNSKKAETVMNSFMRTYPGDKKMVEKDLLDLYETSGAYDKLISFYLNARSVKGVPASDYVAYSLKVAEVQAQRTGKIPPKVMEEALKASQRFASDMKESPKGVEATSKVLFWFANQKENVFYGIKLTLPQKQMEINLQRKLTLLKELERDYSRVAGLGSEEWGLGAIYRTAAAYRTMAQDVAQAPVPAELSAEQVDLYRTEIGKTFIKPFNEKARTLALQCLDKAQEFNLLSSWTPKCYGLASELEPERYPLVRTFYLPPLQSALMLPSKAQSKIAIGGIKSYAYPFFSFALFSTATQERATANLPIDNSALYGETRGANDGPGVSPSLLNYHLLSEERKEILQSALNSEKSSDTKRGNSFAYLNLLRMTSPQRTIPLILEAIQKDPQNNALHNLLALTYLEMNNIAAAKITWYSLVARGAKNAALWNNLGVLAQLEGREEQAIDYFNEASLMEEPKEALINLGFIALKYRNGFEAKKHFEKALALEKNEITSQVGYAIAQLQNRELEGAKERLVDLTRKYKNDPYARISLGYYLMDVEKEHDLARRLLAEFINAQGAENDAQFRQAYNESKKERAPGEELPDIQ